MMFLPNRADAKTDGKEVASAAIMHIPGFMMIGSGIQTIIVRGMIYVCSTNV
jgi:hypothetical protein